MKKIFNKLGLKILAGLLLCSCISGSTTMAMETGGSGSGKQPSRQQRRAAKRQAKKQKNKKQQTPHMLNLDPYSQDDELYALYKAILMNRFANTNRPERREKGLQAQADFNLYLVRERYMKERIEHYYEIERTDKSPFTIEFITGKNIVVNSIEDIKEAINRNTPAAVSKAEDYIKSQGTSAPDFVPICRIKYSVFEKLMAWLLQTLNILAQNKPRN